MALCVMERVVKRCKQVTALDHFDLTIQKDEIWRGPEFLLPDEPAVALDAQNRKYVLDRTREI